MPSAVLQAVMQHADQRGASAERALNYVGSANMIRDRGRLVFKDRLVSCASLGNFA
jgi:hypothetical protein